MGELPHRGRVAIVWLVVVEPVGAFERAPSVVHPPAGTAAGKRDIDLLPFALADVANPQVTGHAVERVAPRVAQADRPDLGSGIVDADVWVVGGHGIRQVIGS